MSRMKDLVIEINDLLDNTYLLAADIAKTLSCPIELVNDVIEYRWYEQTKSPSGQLS